MPTVHALADESVDVRIVVDMSEPMLAKDAGELRQQALEFLIRAMPDAARAGIWSYADYVRIIAKHNTSGGLWKQVASIKAASLVSDGTQADLAGALEAATKSVADYGHTPVNVVLISNGAIRTGNGEQANTETRRSLLQRWSQAPANGRIRVHTLSIGDLTPDQADFMRQLAQVTGGRAFAAKDPVSLQQALLKLTRQITGTPQAELDATGRFYVAPGAQRVSFTWLGLSADSQAPEIEQPDGTVFTRQTSVDDGRWVVGRQFEMISLNAPQPGWWQVRGPTPDQLEVYGEIDAQVAGIGATVVPSDESQARINLFNEGKPIENLDFLHHIHVRAWVVTGSQRNPLPVDRDGTGFVAHLVNLTNGAHTFELEVAAPTFTRHFDIPFMVANPILVEVRPGLANDSVAWLQFSHPEVDYSTVKVSGILRKPPKVATIIPGQRMPGGLWKIPLGDQQGILEVAFTVAGNYLDGKGVYLKTSAHALTMPLEDGESVDLRYDGEGQLLVTPVVEEEIELFPQPPPGSPQGQSATIAGADGANPVGGNDAAASPPEEPSLPLLPLWFVALISLLNLGIGGLIWWLNKPEPLPFTPPDVAEAA